MLNLADWRSPTILLFLFGLLKELRPSEPYITVFFTEFKNVTGEQITEDIYPIGTFSSLGLAVLIFLITDALLYRPIIVLQGITCVVLPVILILANDLTTILVSQFVYGLYLSCEVAYLTYLYASVPVDQYPKVSALCRVAYLLGRLLSGLVGQILVSTHLLNYLQLFYISLTTGSLALIVALALPPPQRSLYFHKKSQNDANTPEIPNHVQILNHIKNDLRAAYSQPYVLAWSVWWAVATGLFLQALTYLQALWLAQTTDAEDQRWNGYVEAIYTLLGSGASVLAARFVFRHSPWKAWVTLSAACFLSGLFLLSSVLTHQIVIEYLLYILYGALYQSALTVASSEIAQNISNDSSALILGLNSFIALVLQSILTVAITSKDGLRLSIHAQFLTYAAIYGIATVAFMILAFVSVFKTTTEKKNNTEPTTDLTVGKLEDKV